MRIACPSCDAEYDVPDALLAGGPKRLRCTRCGHGFTGALPEATPEQAPEPAASWPQATGTASPEPGQPAPTPTGSVLPADVLPERAPPEWAPPPRTPPERPPPTRGPVRHSPIDAPPEDAPGPAAGRLAAAWLGSLALVGAGGVALVLFHTEIAAAWPPAARLYAVLGLG